jgi:hypothetical protein
MNIEMIEYAGWKDCVQLTNGRIRLVVTTEVGPRIIFCGFPGGENLFYEHPQQTGTRGGTTWKTYGGHRLWCSPEHEVDTYAPDNFPVEVEESTDLVRFTAPVERIGVQKVIEISLPEDSPAAVVNHMIYNRSEAAITFAPWALSVMRAGGIAIIPHGIHDPTRLLPTHPLALWGYTNMSDPRWTWGEKYILLRQDTSATGPQKVGCRNQYGWAAYAVNGELFVKRFDWQPEAAYPDFNCNFESYTNADLLEVETLGPLRRVEPGQAATHTEEWEIYNGIPTPRTEKDAEEIASRIQAAA